jgi:hypothetical protein
MPIAASFTIVRHRLRALGKIHHRSQREFSKTDHLANTITQIQQIKNGRWVLVKDNLMF